jgi:hypothetical protein
MRFKQAHSVLEIMAGVVWDRKGILLIDSMPCGETIM